MKINLLFYAKNGKRIYVKRPSVLIPINEKFNKEAILENENIIVGM